MRAGEVLGVSGLMGAGRTEIMQAIFGNLPYDSGKIEIEGKEVKIKSPIRGNRAGDWIYYGRQKSGRADVGRKY